LNLWRDTIGFWDVPSLNGYTFYFLIKLHLSFISLIRLCKESLSLIFINEIIAERRDNMRYLHIIVDLIIS
jgi:hypothetical protein